MYTLHDKCMIECIKVENQRAKSFCVEPFVVYCVSTNLQTGIKTWSFLKRSTLFVNDEACTYLSSAFKKLYEINIIVSLKQPKHLLLMQFLNDKGPLKYLI